MLGVCGLFVKMSALRPSLRRLCAGQVLEEDVLERAWQMIGQRHPEVVHTLYTEPIDFFKQVRSQRGA